MLCFLKILKKVLRMYKCFKFKIFAILQKSIMNFNNLLFFLYKKILTISLKAIKLPKVTMIPYTT